MSKTEKHSVEATTVLRWDVMVEGKVEIYFNFDGIEATSAEEAEKIALKEAQDLPLGDYDLSDPFDFKSFCQSEDGY